MTNLKFQKEDVEICSLGDLHFFFRCFNKSGQHTGKGGGLNYLMSKA